MTLRFFGSLAAVLVVLLVAPVGRASEPAPRERRTSGGSVPAAIDYNAPDHDPTLAHHLHALANLGVQSWALWQLNWVRGEEWTWVTRDSLGSNLHRGFAFDQDEIQTNFLGHPYHGGLMFTSARSAGLGFWISAAYTGAGSLGWELFAETEPPSANDLIMTTLSGLMLGEMTYRLSSELLDDSAQGSWRLWRELAAAAVSPMRGFQRLNTGQAWRERPPPIRQPVRAALHVGAEVVRVRDGPSTDRNGPSLLVAADVAYGELFAGEADTLAPFAFFELYAGISLFDSQLAGARVDTTGLLYGWRRPSPHRRDLRDAPVFGLSMTYEFQGSNVTTYGGVGLGPASYLRVGLGRRRQLRLGIGVDFVPMLSIAETEPAPDARGYTFGIGAASWSTIWLDLAEAGSLRLRARQYATTTVDGGRGAQYVATVRAAYHVDVLDSVGFGAAPMLTYRRPPSSAPAGSTTELSAQLYMRLHP